MFSKRPKKDHEVLKERYSNLEDRYDELQNEHTRLQEETGERTNMRISHIEEELDSMNDRVEKLARDSYEIHSEVREIHESVFEMRNALSDIVSLYKAILTQYGFKGMAPKPAQATQRTLGHEPGDDIIRALEGDEKTYDEGPPARELKEEGTAAQGTPSEAGEAPPSALDELQRVAEDSRRSGEGAATLARRLAERDGGEDRVDRVAKRDLGRMDSVKVDQEGEFLRPLPKKELQERSGPERAPPPGKGPDDGPKREGWEETPPPKEKKPRPSVEDLLEPH